MNTVKRELDPNTDTVQENNEWSEMILIPWSGQIIPESNSRTNSPASEWPWRIMETRRRINRQEMGKCYFNFQKEGKGRFWKPYNFNLRQVTWIDYLKARVIAISFDRITENKPFQINLISFFEMVVSSSGKCGWCRKCRYRENIWQNHNRMWAREWMKIEICGFMYDWIN